MCLAVPGRIVEIGGETPLNRTGKVDFGGIAREINLMFLPDAAVGDYVLVHVGFALAKIDAEEANRTLEFLGTLEDNARIEEGVG